mmetsp:Transcript_7060/g.17241  ORF Transcript_7060/g.17241 Transcript_7060/m.17241 type:complete len:319 (+) Transcript_7060:1107-2063(+)
MNLAAASLFSGTAVGVSSAETDRLSRGQRWTLLFGSHVASAHETVNFCQDALKRRVDPTGIEGGRLDKSQIVLFRKAHGLVRLDRPKMAQITFVSHQHDNNVGLGVVPKFLEPSLDVFKGPVLGNVINQQGPDGSSVIGRRNCPIALLPGSVPDLCLDGLSLGLDRFSREFDANGTLGFEVEFVAGESTQQVRLSDSGIPDQDNLEQVIVFFVNSCRHFDLICWVLLSLEFSSCFVGCKRATRMIESCFALEKVVTTAKTVDNKQHNKYGGHSFENERALRNLAHTRFRGKHPQVRLSEAFIARWKQNHIAFGAYIAE